MQARRATSADADLLRRLDSGFRGQVHSVFERTINVEVDGGLVTLASCSVDNAPDTLIVAIEGFGNLAIARGDPVRCVAGVLRAGGLEVGLDGVSRWSGALPAWPHDDTTLRANLRRVRARLRRAGSGGNEGNGGGGFGQSASPDSFADAACAALDEREALLQDALVRTDLAAARARAAALIGLGPGLTPSGDDFLVGLFAVLNVANSPCHPMRAICDGVVAIARTSTHAISVAALANAARGRVRGSIEALMRAMIDGAPDALCCALDRVLAIGATSGSEIAAGLASGFAANLQAGARALGGGARTPARRPAAPYRSCAESRAARSSASISRPV
jgi:hypothetical protein